MSVIIRQDSNGTKPLLQVGELGYDNYPSGGDKGRVWVGTGTENIAQAKKSEVMAVDSKADTHIARTNNPHGVTKAQVGLENVDNTSDVNKPISTATQGVLNLKANANNAALTGVPTAPTAAVGTNTTQLATTAFVNAEIANDTPSKDGAGASGTWGISISGNSATATKLVTARTIGGVSFDGSANINLPGVNAAGNQSTTGNSATATKLQTARTINGVSFDGTADITVSDSTAVKLTGDQTIAGVKTFSASPIVPTPTTGTHAVNMDYVSKVMASGGRDVYLGSYGLEWNETADTYRRIGAENYTAIQSLMKRCVLNADGSVKYYLDPNNSNYKEDGTLADLTGADGNVMVEVPKTYVRYEYTTTGGAGTDTVHRWEISLTPDTGFEAHWAFDRGGVIRDKRYYPAYQGYVTGGKMISRSGVYPTVSQTLAQFRTAAKANSVSNPSTGQTVNGYWGNIDFALYELITLLAVIEYGTMNIQSALGRGRTALTGGTWVGGSYIGVNGLSNKYGNRTANYTYIGSAEDANADLSFMSYRGCENFFGNVWRMADGVIFKGTTTNKTMWYSTNPIGYNETGTGYTNSGIVTANASGYGRKLANTNRGFIVSDVTGGNSNAGTTDYYYTGATDNTLALVGGYSSYGLTAGPLYLAVYDSAASLSNATVSCGVSF